MNAIKSFASKATGADVAADAAQRGADEQAAATRQAADQAAAAAREAAQQSATMQSDSAARNSALSASAEALAVKPETPTVVIDDKVASGAAAKRRQKFGIGSASSGVNI